MKPASSRTCTLCYAASTSVSRSSPLAVRPHRKGDVLCGKCSRAACVALCGLAVILELSLESCTGGTVVNSARSLAGRDQGTASDIEALLVHQNVPNVTG